MRCDSFFQEELGWVSLNRGRNFFSQNIVLLGIKRFVFLRRFQKCKLTYLSDKMPPKPAILEKSKF
jgi:hypothetical protein